jgi:poly(A) polymerase
MTEAHHPDPVRYGETIIFPASLDPEAVHVVRRLCEAGLESYLVGGCVRDLLMGLIPKDFDISTEARPRQIRRLFRNSRIIGRRFKLAHIHFGEKVIEVATFRRTPDGTGTAGGESTQDEDLLITRDNEFGDAREDALRRDFTINALLYDVRSAEVIDHVGGVHDLTARTLRTIGAPAIRLAEDPVRMLRAVKFAARLQLHFDADLETAMSASAELILKSAPPRVLEEIYKLLTCGAAQRALPMLQRYGLLDRLLPAIADDWRDHPAELEATGHALDLIDRGRRRVSNAFLLAALLLRPWHRRVLESPGGDPLQPAHDLLDPVARHMSIPRRDVAIAKHLLLGVLRLERPRRGRRTRGADPQRDGGEPLALLYLGALTGVLDPEVHARWIQRLLGEPAHSDTDDGLEDALHAGDETLAGEEALAGGPRRGRRRRRGGRRHRGRDRAAAGQREPGDGRDGEAGGTARGPSQGAEPGEPAGWQDREAGGGRDDELPQGPHPLPDGEPGERTAGAGEHGPEGLPGRRRRGRRGGRGRRRREDSGDARGAGAPSADAPSHPEDEWQGPIQQHPGDDDVAAPGDPSAQDGMSRRADGEPPRGDRPERGAAGERDGRPRSRSRGGRRRRRGRPATAGDSGAGNAPRQGGESAEPSGSGQGRPDSGAGRPQREARNGRQGEGGAASPRPDNRPGQRREAAPAAARGRRGGDRPRRDDDRPRRDPDAPPRDDTPARGPGQRHPEDVEDFFDW